MSLIREPEAYYSIYNDKAIEVSLNLMDAKVFLSPGLMTPVFAFIHETEVNSSASKQESKDSYV